MIILCVPFSNLIHFKILCDVSDYSRVIVFSNSTYQINCLVCYNKGLPCFDLVNFVMNMLFRIALRHWRHLKSKLDEFIGKELLLFRMGSLTQQIFQRVKAEVPRLVEGKSVVTELDAAPNMGSGDSVAIFGDREVTESLKIELMKMVSKFEAELQEERSVKETVIPNILAYQIEYLNLVKFFDIKCKQYKLESFTSDSSKQQIRIKGVPKSIEAVQKEMLELLPNIALSKVSMNRKPLFLNVLKTTSARQAVEKQMLAAQIKAYWTIENKTILVYSESRSISETAMDCIRGTVWDAEYPVGIPFDDLEKQVVRSELWRDKKKEMQQRYLPLEIVEVEDCSRLIMAGLSHSEASVVEDIPLFFDHNVKRTSIFNGNPDRILFLNKRRREILKDLEKEWKVELTNISGGSQLQIAGTKHGIASCERALREMHDSVCMSVHTIENRAMIQYINEESNDVFENAGLRNDCLVVPHRKDAAMSLAFSHLSQSRQAAGFHYSLKLSNGTDCEVLQADITSLACDAIVNAANGDLKHVGGLAQAIVQKGIHIFIQWIV